AGQPRSVNAQASDLFSGFSFSPDLPVFHPPPDAGFGGSGKGDRQPPNEPLVPPGLPSADPLWLPLPYAPHGGSGQPSVPEAQVVLEAKLTPDAAPLAEGVFWRVFASEPDRSGDLRLVATAEGGTTSLLLDPGAYFVHASYGRAGATKRLSVGQGTVSETLVLEAGALRLGAVVGEDQSISPGQLTFEVLQKETNGSRTVILPDARPGVALRLNAGTYHVVSRYGTLNAVIRADIEVRPGKLTDATVRHKAAEATLKLVTEPGGEALANTSWAVLTRGGDTIHESVGAFPRIVLAEGSYTAVARHKGRIYARDFDIVPGLNRDIEVGLTDELPAEPTAARGR
ncbi:MAG TPA: hypothetical protein VHG92_13625, partial [Afifellaceae bacterium]|nr:hypothetical protein [Afifellaceae bacterium]